MRIALVITELDPGGAELCLTELALYLARAGHSVKVWAIGAEPDTGRDGLACRLTAAGIDVLYGSARGMFDSWRVVRWLRRELLAFKPDTVQSMLWHANMMTAGALWTSRIPWVAGMRVSEPRSGRWWMERWASRRMQRMVCVSDDVYDHALRKERIDASKLVVIPNGVPSRWLTDSLPDVAWQRFISSPSDHKLLFVGRLEPQKGIMPLVDHVPQILEGLPDWSLAMLGSGSLHAHFQARLHALDLDKQVYLIGWQPDAPHWMNAADALVLPAVYEGMPNVLLEAMAVGKPFVAFAVDGVRQLVKPSQGYPAELASAQLAQPGNWGEFVSLVRKQMTQPQLRKQCGQANRSHVSQHFRLEDQLAKYLTLYQSLQS